eukprot:Clim_evm105s152 gene=Clim_evmTU105s152
MPISTNEESTATVIRGDSLENIMNKGESAEIKLHQLPVDIAYDGPARVDDYFWHEQDSNREGIWQARFRGRELVGRTEDIPEGFVGLVVTEERKAVTEDHGRAWRATGTFKKIHLWERENPPDEDNSFAYLLKMTQLASKLNKDFSSAA